MVSYYRAKHYINPAHRTEPTHPGNKTTQVKIVELLTERHEFLSSCGACSQDELTFR